ncbi:MAG: TonB-dependent receptor [Bacteroidota bacterium]
MKFVFSFLLCCLQIVVIAQIDTSQIFELVPVTVQSTRFETSDLQSPLATTSLANAFIQRGQAQLSVNESLDAVPGLFALNPNNFAQDLRVSIRGFGARAAFGIRGVKILVDGIPESTPDGQAQVDNLDLGVLENIEVVRGPSSGLYGNASGGVIQFTTQNPTPTTPFWELGLSGGSYQMQQYQIKTGQQLGKFSFLLHGMHVKTDGYRENSGMKNTILNGKFNYQLSPKSSLQFLANYANSPQADDPGGINLAQATEDRRSARDRNLTFRGGEAIEQSRFGLIFKSDISEDQQLEIKTWISTRDFANRLPFGFGGIVEFDRTFTGLTASYSLDKKLFGLPYRLKIGVDLQNQADDRKRFFNEEGEKGNRTLDQKEEFLSLGTYLVQELSLSEQLIATLGLRYDAVRLRATDNFLNNGDQSGESTLNNFNPTFGLVYSVSEAANIYGNVSTNFETPTLNELSNNPTGEGGFNPNLMPQEATNFEVGIKGIAANKLRYELALFAINVTDEIVSFELEEFPDRDFFRNAGSTDRKGLEISLTYNVAKGLNALLNYTYSDFKYDDFQSFNGNFLPGIPQHATFFALNYSRIKGLFGSLQVKNVGDLFAKDDNSITVEGYTVVNLKLGYKYEDSKWGVEPFFGINNLFGAEYFDNVRINAFGSRFYEPAPTTNFYGGVKFYFGK